MFHVLTIVLLLLTQQLLALQMRRIRETQSNNSQNETMRTIRYHSFSVAFVHKSISDAISATRDRITKKMRFAIERRAVTVIGASQVLTAEASFAVVWINFLSVNKSRNVS